MKLEKIYPNFLKKDEPPNKGVLSIKLFEISNKCIKDVQTELHNESWIEDVLPEYIVVDGEIHETTDYFDNVDFCSEVLKDDEKTWKMFDVDYVHALLQYEIDEIGFVDFVKELQLAEYLKKLEPQSGYKFIKDYNNETAIFILIQIDSIPQYDYYSGATEYETETEILGHFDEDFKLQCA